MKIDIERLKEHLTQLAVFGRNEDSGITRLAFGPEYSAANDYVKGLMVEAGMKVYQDPVGNLFGKCEGKPEAQSILIGSHIDTVPNGGKFDGSLGVISALEAVQTLIENGYANNNSIEVAAFIAEEFTGVGSTFGSRCFTGDFGSGDRERSFLKEYGLTEDDVSASRRAPESIKNYLELHVEQGGILDAEQIPVGVVTGIVGILRLKGEVRGTANHAGTTPMGLRDDALLKASGFIQYFNRMIREIGDPLVGTIGVLEIGPGAVNVIPDRVSFHIELRDIDSSRMRQAVKLMENYDPDISITEYLYEKEKLMDQSVQDVISAACETQNCNYKIMHSGAGHDAGILSHTIPTAMIFVPSVGGISHSPLEHTEWEDIEKGSNVLLETIMQLDR